MFWAKLEHIDEKEFFRAINEIKSGSDRAAALVGGAFVDEQLTIYIKRALVDNVKILEKMFRSNGPLSTFSSRIDMALLMALIDIHTHKELNTIREIRNEFAHRVGASSFDTQRVSDLSANLVLCDKHPLKVTPDDKPHSKIYIPEKLDKKDITPKLRYIRSCQYYLLALQIIPIKRLTIKSWSDQ